MDASSRRASKRARADESPTKKRVSKFKSPSAAVKWQKDGCPEIDFLKQLGLDCLAKISWKISDKDADSVAEFIRNYDPETHQSKVAGFVANLTPELIAQVLNIPNRGIYRHRKIAAEDANRLELFTEGAHKCFGFLNTMATDPTKARIFTLLSQVVFFKSPPCASYTGVVALDAISRALEGQAVNWPRLIHQRLCGKLRALKMKELQADKFRGSPWIAHFLPAMISSEQSQHRQDSSQADVIRIRLGPAILAKLSGRAQAQGRKLREAEERAGETLVQLQEARRALETREIEMAELGKQNCGLKAQNVWLKLQLEVSEEKLVQCRADLLKEKLYGEQLFTIAGLQAELKQNIEQETEQARDDR